MNLKSWCEEDCKKRHDTIWLELIELLKSNGISENSIFWDETTNILFPFQKVQGSSTSQDHGIGLIVKKWWKYLADIRETNDDHSPVSYQLQEVFHFE